jgi:bifunctional non-homologous end joining protein LigD
VTSDQRNAKRSAPLPRAFRPQLARAARQPPDGNEWLHEVKFDGYRIACRKDGTDIRLSSRNGKDWTSDFPEVRTAAAQLQADRAFLDGEVAVLLPDGRTSFQALQNVIGSAPPRDLVYFVFDLLHLDGEDVARLPLERRKARLKRLLAPLGVEQPIRYADHIIGRGPEFFKQACRHRLEGIVSKRRDLPYQGGRSQSWLKAKCRKRQEFVIGGFTEPEGSRLGIGALLVGVHDPTGALVFAGKVGTGFTQKSAQAIRHRLDALEQSACPFATRPEGRLGRSAHWVRPTLVAEVVFGEWTDDGKIRQPSFQGVRADKSPRNVYREEPASAPSASRRGGKGAPPGR